MSSEMSLMGWLCGEIVETIKFRVGIQWKRLTELDNVLTHSGDVYVKNSVELQMTGTKSRGHGETMIRGGHDGLNLIVDLLWILKIVIYGAWKLDNSE